MNYIKILALFLIRFYQHLSVGILVPLFGRVCRFEPSCSHFALQALEILPPGLALQRIVRRVFTCHPFHAGGWDPVQKEF